MTYARIEPLEHRIAPAALVNPTTATYRDVDGDTVTVKFSKAILTEDNLNSILKFSEEAVDATTPQQLQEIDLTGLVAGLAQGVNISVVATSSTAGGNGFANVGAINAEGRDLGVVTIDGDLGRIRAGDTEGGGDLVTIKTNSLKSLTVQSMGELGLSTQADGGSLASVLRGPVGAIVIKGNQRDARIDVDGFEPAQQEFNKVASFTVGGSMIAGGLFAAGNIGKVNVGGDIIGGSAESSSRIDTFFGIGPVTVGGSITGAGGQFSAAITAKTSVGLVKVGGDIRSGGGPNSAVINATDSIAGLTVGGSILGGAGDLSVGAQFLSDRIGNVSVGGDIRGGVGSNTGTIFGLGSLGNVTVGGSLIGGSGSGSAGIWGGDAGASKGTGAVVIKGDVIGGDNFYSGSIYAGAGSGGIGLLKSVTIGGSLIAGDGIFSGSIDAWSMGPVKIAGDFVGGGVVTNAGVIYARAKSSTITLGGSMYGGSSDESGAIILGNNLEDSAPLVTFGAVKIGGNITGGLGEASGAIIAKGTLSSVSIGGSIFAGEGESAAAIAARKLSSVAIVGSIYGTATDRITISGGSATDHLAIGALTVGGSVNYVDIFGGVDRGQLVDGDARINSVVVTGDWVASNLTAGIVPTASIGDGDDELIDANDDLGVVSTIGSLTIGGQAIGSLNSGDHYGVVALQMGKLKVGSTTYLPQQEGFLQPLGFTGDFLARTALTGAAGSAPAAITNLIATPGAAAGTSFSFYDRDGDLVKVTTNLPVLDTADFVLAPQGLGNQFQRLDLSDDSFSAPLNITITAVAQDRNGDGIKEGDGFVNVGEIFAPGKDLGTVTVSGDLTRIIAGDNNLETLGVVALNVHSMYRYDAATLAVGRDPTSEIVGGVKSISIKTDYSAKISIQGLGAGDEVNLGAFGVGGSVLGGTSETSQGYLSVAGQITSIKVGKDVIGTTQQSARLYSGGSIGGVTIGGSIIGGGLQSGSVTANQSLGAVVIGGDVIGGTGASSGNVVASLGAMKSITISGSLRGGVGSYNEGSAAPSQVYAQDGIGSVLVTGSLVAGAGAYSGTIQADGNVTSITVNGSLLANLQSDVGAYSAHVRINNNADVSLIKVGGNVFGGDDSNSGSIYVSGYTKSVTIGGSVEGGLDEETGRVYLDDGADKVVIGGSLRGGGDAEEDYATGSIGAERAIGFVTIGGSISNLYGQYGGGISADQLTKVTIGRDIDHRGGSFQDAIYGYRGIGSVVIGGSVYAGVTDGDIVDTQGSLGSLSIKGSVTGSLESLARFRTADLVAAEGFKPYGVGSITIGGSVESASFVFGGGNNADAFVNSIFIGGDYRTTEIYVGVNPFTGTVTGDGLESAISKISSLTIGRQVVHSGDSSAVYRITAEHIVALKAGGVKYQLAPGPRNDGIAPGNPISLEPTAHVVFAEAMPPVIWT